MVLEVFKYECHNSEYMIYDCNKNEYEFGGREVRVMCSLEVGLMIRKILVIPVKTGKDITVEIFDPDGTIVEPQYEDLMVLSKYLDDAGYERTKRSNCGRSSDESVKKISKMAFFDNFILKYNLKRIGA